MARNVVSSLTQACNANRCASGMREGWFVGGNLPSRCWEYFRAKPTTKAFALLSALQLCSRTRLRTSVRDGEARARACRIRRSALTTPFSATIR
jgi:hypothetical protein